MQSASPLSWGAAGIGAKECLSEAKHEIEKTYCQILEKSGPASLPNFHQFRQNPIKMQTLLLKGPARKAGISIPEDITTNAPSPIKPTPVITAPPEADITLSQPRKAKPENKPEPPMTFPGSGSTTSAALASCQLDKSSIDCAGDTRGEAKRYELQSNLNLKQLDPMVLSDQNRLEFPDRQGNESIVQYLSRVYPTYIEKMLLLGLGDTTMSFTKFNAMFHETVKQGLSFTRRFRDMYELLKKERKTQAIKSRYNDLYPDSIENCMRLTTKLIACDNVKQNWIYASM